MSIEDGIYSLIKSNIPDFEGVDDQGSPEYKLFGLVVFDPVPPPYAVFKRQKQEALVDLENKPQQIIATYTIEIYHNDSWALVGIKQRIIDLLWSLPMTTLETTGGGIYIQRLIINDSTQETPPKIEEARVRIYEEIIEFEITY